VSLGCLWCGGGPASKGCAVWEPQWWSSSVWEAHGVVSIIHHPLALLGSFRMHVDDTHNVSLPWGIASCVLYRPAVPYR